MVYLDILPIWAVYISTVIGVLIMAEIGFRMGLRMQDRAQEIPKSQISSTSVASILGLMAFLMAITIGIVLNQHSGRKEMVVTEANGIGTAWLRAGFLPEPDRTTARDLLYEYTKIRVDSAENTDTLDATIARSEEIHTELWAILEENVSRDNDSESLSLLIESINDVIDIHTLRLTAVELRLPRVFGFLLFGATLLSFLLVGVAGSADRKRDFAALLLFALAYVAVLTLIVDLDRPQEGLVTVNQTAMDEVLRQITPAGQ